MPLDLFKLFCVQFSLLIYFLSLTFLCATNYNWHMYNDAMYYINGWPYKDNSSSQLDFKFPPQIRSYIFLFFRSQLIGERERYSELTKCLPERFMLLSFVIASNQINRMAFFHLHTGTLSVFWLKYAKIR